MLPEATKPCPHCGAALPANARFCRDCGKPIEPETPEDAAALPAAAAAEQPEVENPEDAATLVPIEQPDAAAATLVPAASATVAPEAFQEPAPVYQPQSPIDAAPGGWPADLPAAAPSKPGASRPRRRKWLPGLLAAVIVVALVGGVGAFFFARSHQASQSSAVDRHGLRADIPLPANSAFATSLNLAGTNQHVWVYTIKHTAASVVVDFFQAHLPSNGWQNIEVFAPGVIASSGVLACRNNASVDITINSKGYSEYGFAAPGDGVLLDISVTPDGC